MHFGFRYFSCCVGVLCLLLDSLIGCYGLLMGVWMLLLIVLLFAFGLRIVVGLLRWILVSCNLWLFDCLFDCLLFV